MKRTASTLAVLGLALSGSAVPASDFGAPGGRVERQPSADPQAERGPGPRLEPGGRETRGGGAGDARRDGRDRDGGGPEPELAPITARAPPLQGRLL